MKVLSIQLINEKFLVRLEFKDLLLRRTTININILDLIRTVRDPEHPLSLEELHVVEESKVEVDNEKNTIHIFFTPTIPHCSMATLIGLSIRVKLYRTLPPRFKVTVEVTPGTHVSADSINKQLADKERVAAALENKHLITFINNTFVEDDK